MTATTLVAEEKSVDYNKVRDAIAALMDDMEYDDGSYGPLLIRLAWHSSGSYCAHRKNGGSNGGTIRFAPESEYGANAGLHVARNLLEPVKAKFPGISYADLYTLAGVVAVEEMGGPTIEWRAGRTDAADGSACQEDGRLPDAAQGEYHLRDIFYRMGFDDREIVCLSGAHTFGRCHLDRSGFVNPWTNAPTTFSNLYFQELLNKNWTKKLWNGPIQFEDPSGTLMMLPTDMAVRFDPTFNKYARQYADDEELFRKDFAKVFSKLLHLGVPCSKQESKWSSGYVLAGLVGLFGVGRGF